MTVDDHFVNKKCSLVQKNYQKIHLIHLTQQIKKKCKYKIRKHSYISSFIFLQSLTYHSFSYQFDSFAQSFQFDLLTYQQHILQIQIQIERQISQNSIYIISLLFFEIKFKPKNIIQKYLKQQEKRSNQKRQIIIMWSIYQENIEKKYFAPILSRGFFVSAICYLIAFIVPALILASIGYSIEENTKVLLKPTLKYENYQFFCLDTNQLTIYDSSFDGQSSKSFTSTVLVGNDNNNFAVSIYVPTTVYSCTLLTYNKILLNNNNQILVTIPFSFYQPSSTLNVNKFTQKGKIEVMSSSPLLDSAILNSQSSYNKAQQFSIIDNALYYSSRNLSGFVNVAIQRKQVDSSGATQFQGNYEIQSNIFIKGHSLLDKIRSFVPFYIYLWLPILFFIIIPLIQWMFDNKIYYSKVQKAKVKLD